jgi:serine phosphatase RsbU (regulator of sigma subunit)/CHASE2 domain-containing sensor protein
MLLQRAMAGVAATLASLFLYAASPLPLERIELSVYDMMLPLRSAKNPSPAPVIVDIDEHTLESVRQWPWPRYLVADLVAALSDYNVAASGFDILFSERDNSSPSEMSEYLKRDRNLDVTFGRLPPDMYDYDKLLAGTLKNSYTVLAAFAGGDSVTSGDGIPDSVNLIERASPDAIPDTGKIYSATGGVLPLPEFRSRKMGVINIEPDADGIIRRIPLVVSMGGKIYPTLSLRTLMEALETDNLTVGYGDSGLEYVAVGAYSARVSSDGFMNIPFIGPQRTYEYVSAVDVLNRTVPRETLEGRVVFVGSSASGLSDIHAIPLDPLYPGVETHAAVLDAILTGNAITAPPAAPLIQTAAILAAGCFGAVLFGFARPRVYIPIAAALTVSAVAVSCVFFANGVHISPLYAALTFMIIALSLLPIRFIQEERQKFVIASELADERLRAATAQADLDAARRIQAGALTRDFPPYPNFPEVEARASMRPAKEVGGDFYDCFPANDDRLVIAIADVSGKGIPAALFMMKALTIVKSQAMSGALPDAILAAANDLLCRDNDAGMFVTAFVGVYGRRKGAIEFSNAGHNPPLLVRNGAPEYLNMVKNCALGYIEGVEYALQEIPFGEGDAFVLYTDGVTEAMNGSKEQFGEDRLLSLAGEIFKTTLDARASVLAIDSAVASHVGEADQSDDVTILVMKKI